MVTIPLALRTVAGLDRSETKVLVFVVQEWRRRQAGPAKPAWRGQEALASNHVTKHMKMPHVEAKKIIDRLRRKGLLRLEERQSGGPTGYGWDGALFGALTPSATAERLVDQYLAE